MYCCTGLSQWQPQSWRHTCLLFFMHVLSSSYFSHWLNHSPRRQTSTSNAKQERYIFHLSNNWIFSIPSSVGLKPQSRQMDVTQRFMSSSDSATKYQILSSVLRSKTKLLSSSFFVKERPASTWRRGRNGADLLLSNSQATLRIY